MQVSLCLENGDTLLLEGDPAAFQIGQKVVIENGPLYRIEDVQHQFRKVEFGYRYICTNLIGREILPS